jgi:hypothetical protein
VRRSIYTHVGHATLKYNCFLSLSHIYADYNSKVELQEVSQDEQGMFSAYCMENLESLDKNEYSFNNQPDFYDMAEALIGKFEEQKTDFPAHPPY